MTCSARREALLLAQGWKKQFLADEPRLSEAVAQYLQLGFQVHLEDVDPAACREAGGCASCYQQPEMAARFKIIFTRPAARPSTAEDI